MAIERPLPVLWVAVMSLRTTSEIAASPFGWPSPAHWGKYRTVWTTSHYDTYFWNSTVIVLTAVAALTLIGSMAAARACHLEVLQ